MMFSLICTITIFLFCLNSNLFVESDAYNPVDLFSINCGSSGNFSDGDIAWTGDINSKFLSTQDSSTSQTAQALTQSSSTRQVPYATARLSHSQFTYSFPVTPGQKFLRLYFYSSSYPAFDRSNAFFTVTSGGFTLLKDFNASVTADADVDGSKTVSREYSINVDEGDQRLNLTFIPNKTINSDSYAFINGIQIVSMPTDLYYTNSDDSGFLLVGHAGSPFSIENDSALETQYRLNVGGTTLSLGQDTGMFRSWMDDNSFVKSPSALPAAITPVNVTYSKIPDYVAPNDIYQTARSMGTDSGENKRNNLTWEFSVDSGFTYMVRLHFCEIDPNIRSVGDRAFFIYIAQQIAEDHADVLRWSQWGVPIYRDYAVSMFGNQKKSILSLQMHPLPDSETTYSDAFLNGLEIFKISDPASKNLAGPNPDPIPSPPDSGSNVQKTKKGSSSKTTIIGVVVGVVAVVVLIFGVLAFFVVAKRRKRVMMKDSKSTTNTGSKWGPMSYSTTKSTNTLASSLPSDLCRYFSIAEIRAATNNFDELFIIGAGGFGHVYKGYIDEGSTPVAIKRLKPDSQQGAHEFKTEIEMLSQLRHLHLVSLIGYCNENNEMILVYDFMARGTLREHLYNTDNPPLAWKQRLQICIGAAKGLHYLHTGATHTIIHRDVKSTNILLDEKWMAKVSDFGLSRIGPTGMSKAHVSTVVKGSVGYLDPEYYKRQRLTEKSDVYSFGVVLFEILCARPALVRTVEKKQVSLADWARSCHQMGTLTQIVDPALKGKIAPECLRKFGEIGVSCLLDDGTQRPAMNDVVWGLEFALQLQENAEKREEMSESESERKEEGGGKINVGDSNNEYLSSTITSSNNTSSGVVSTTTTSSGGNSYGSKDMSATVFSEIMDPKAR